MTDPNPTGDVAAALAAAEEHAQVLPDVEDGNLLIVARRTDRAIDTLDLERFLPAPTRPRGTVQALTAQGFVDAFTHRTVDETPAVVYADVDAVRLVAVLNDDEADRPGWRDHRITYEPLLTPEWRHWAGHQGLGSQERFAQALEDGETEIRKPSATKMLELAQTFHASVGAKFKQAGRLRDGRTQLVYEEEIEATAGDGMAEIPDTFTIEVRPFYGAKPVEVVCRLRYRLERGQLVIGYTIQRPDEIVRTSFETDVVGRVRDQLKGSPVIEASPADALQAGR